MMFLFEYAETPEPIDDYVALDKTPRFVCCKCGRKAWGGHNIEDGVPMLHVYCLSDHGCRHVEKGPRDWRTAPAVARSDDPYDIAYANFDEMMDRVCHYLGPEATLKDFVYKRTVRGDYMWRTEQAARIYGSW